MCYRALTCNMEILVWLFILSMCWKKKQQNKHSYILALNGSSLTLWTLLGLGRDRWNLIYKPMLCIPPLLDVTLSVPASLFPSLYVFVVCVYLLSFFCLSFFFHFFSLLKAPLIYKETRKPFSPIFSVNWSNHGQSCKGSAVLFFGPLTSVTFMPSPTFSFLIF